jgi:hypothetical protein
MKLSEIKKIWHFIKDNISSLYDIILQT